MGEMGHRRGRKGPHMPPGRRGTAPGTPGGERREPGFAAVDDYVRAQMKAARIPGLALAIVQDGRAVHLRGFGRADDGGRAFTPQTPFFIGSNSKSFTALAVMQLAEAGLGELDAPVRRYIPWFRVADPQASGQITIRHLLNQTSGLSEAAGNRSAGRGDAAAGGRSARAGHGPAGPAGRRGV